MLIVGLVLGDRASPHAVRDGTDRADINAMFDVTAVTDAKQWLSDHEMDQEDECILRRVVSKDGKSRAFTGRLRQVPERSSQSCRTLYAME